jgi:ABC-type molybdenum transport system ATPase subunit/photorepair protein PhrA
MSDNELIEELREKISNMEERLKAIEKEQRMIREDILSGSAKERMQQRLLENAQKKSEELKKKLDKDIKIGI